MFYGKRTGQTGSKNQLTTSDIKNTTPEDAKRVADALINKAAGNTGLKLDTKTMLLIGGAGIALLLILKKK